MEKIRFHSEEEAQKKLDEDFEKICDILEPYYEPYAYLPTYELNSFFSENDYRDIDEALPDGWVLNASDYFTITYGENIDINKNIYIPTIIPNLGDGNYIADLQWKVVKK